MSDAERPGQQPDSYGPPQQPPHGAAPWQPYGPAATPQPYSQPGPYGPPPNPYGVPPAQPGQPGQPRKSKLPLVLVAAGLALLLVVGITIAALTGRDDSTATGSDPKGGSAPAADKPSDAVRGYLEALAANDADRALGYLDEPPADTTFLTRPVLEASAKKAPISAVDVPEVTDEYAYQVPASYTFGNQPIQEDFSVTKESGSWRLSRAVSEFDLGYQRDETLPMTINGVEVTTDKVSLFPGVYAFSADSKWVTYGDKAEFRLTGPSDYDAPRLTPTLSSAGRSAFLKATKTALDKCLAQRKIAPSGCPNRIALRKGQKVTESTIRWSLTADPFKNARVTLDSSDPTVAEASFYPRYRVRANGSDNGRSVRFDGEPFGIYSFRSTAELSGDKVTVDLVSR